MQTGMYNCKPNPTLPPSNPFSSFYLTLVLSFPLPIVSPPPRSNLVSSLSLCLSISGLHHLPGWSFWCGEASWSTTGPDEILSQTPWRPPWMPRCSALHGLLGVSVVMIPGTGVISLDIPVTRNRLFNFGDVLDSKGTLIFLFVMLPPKIIWQMLNLSLNLYSTIQNRFNPFNRTNQKQRKVSYLQKFELSWVCKGWKHLFILLYGQLKHTDVITIQDPRVIRFLIKVSNKGF